MYLSRKQIKSICTHCSFDEDTVFRVDRGVVHLVARRLRGCIFTFRHSRTSNSIVTNLYRGRRQHRYFSSTDTYQKRDETQQAGYNREERQVRERWWGWRPEFTKRESNLTCERKCVNDAKHYSDWIRGNQIYQWKDIYNYNNLK